MRTNAAYTPQQLREIYGLLDRGLSNESLPYVVIEITANLTALNAPELHAMVVDNVSRGNTFFLFDLTECPYVDRRGLSGLERVALLITDRGGELVIANAHQDLKTLFAIKGISKLVRYHDSAATRPT